MADEQDVKIAVLDTKMEGLRLQHKEQSDRITDMLNQQNKAQDSKFDKLFDYIKPAVEFAQQNKGMPDQVKVLWDFHQQNKGFLSATRLLTAAIGGAMVAAIDWFFGRHGG